MKNPLVHIAFLLLPDFYLLFLTLQASKGIVGREENRSVNIFKVAFSRKLFPP